MRPLDAGIIGGGTAGAAAATFLARAGHRVTVYERVPVPGPIGAGITMQPTGLHVLSRLGLYDHVVARGSRLDVLRCLTTKRREIVALSYATIDRELFGLGLHRGVLFEALHGAAIREANVTVRTGIEIVDLARTRRPGWSYFVDVARGLHGPHELVVVADGARSQLRDDTSTSKRVEAYPWGALWFVGRDARAAGDAGLRCLHQVADGNRRFLGLLPTGFGPGVSDDALAKARSLVSLFWSIRADQVPAWRAAGLARWKEEVVAMDEAARPILDQIDDVSQVLFAAYHDVVMHRWSTRNVVYLGDAAHATSPQLGQGCNLALWDAMELDAVLAEEPRDLARALDAYSRRRRDHLAFYQFATRWLTPFFQGDVAALGSLRDFAMPLFGKLPIFTRLMTLSMLGIVDGFEGRTLTVDLPRG